MSDAALFDDEVARGGPDRYVTEGEPRMRERDVLDLLRDRYTRIRAGTNADRFVRAEHPRMPHDWANGYSYGTAVAIADYVVLDTYGHGAVIGHEVKVSRSDWLAELRQPEKSEAWRRYCTQWYLVCPDPSIVRGDLPDGWGLMCLDRSRVLRVKRRAPVNEDRAEMPLTVVSQLGRSIAQTAQRDGPIRLIQCPECRIGLKTYAGAVIPGHLTFGKFERCPGSGKPRDEGDR